MLWCAASNADTEYNGVAMTTVRAQLLGTARVNTAAQTVDFAPDKRYQFLAYLAYQGDWVSRDDLAHLFWPDVVDGTARHSLRQLLKRVRKLEWLSSLEVGRHKVRWAVSTDVDAFNSALERTHWAEALDVYRGPLLRGLDSGASSIFLGWLEHEREHLHGLWRGTVLRHARQLEREGMHLEAASHLGGLLEHDDLDEDALRAYLNALFHAGQRRQALHVYDAFAERLERELELTPTVVTERLIEIIKTEQPAQLTPDPTPQEVAMSLAVLRGQPALPMPPTPFVGRDLELAEVAHLLSQKTCRLLTLTGLGGVGKSRLALQAAEELLPRYQDGVYLISLDTETSTVSIPNVIAAALGIALQGKDAPLTQLIRHIGEKQMLLVLDNFEHLVEESAIAAELVQHCPKLDLLVTSRERLELMEEQLLPLQGLSFLKNGTASIEEALGFDAVRLFVERACRVRSDFSPGEAELPHLLTICRLVDGFPLGLELAAVWVRVMPVADIAAELEHSLDFLSSSSRNVPERQGSIRAVFEHSWKLLTTKEQEVLRRLAVFKGGFRREAASLVTGAPIAVLAALVDKSLLRVTPDGRFDRHPLLYEYMREKLTEHNREQVETEAKHAKFYLQFLQRWGEGLKGGKQKEAAEAIHDELENIRIAWRKAVAEGWLSDLEHSARPLALFYQRQALHREGSQIFAEAATSLDEADLSHQAVLGTVLVCQALLCCNLDQHVQARELAQHGLRLLRPFKRAQGIMSGVNVLGLVAWHVGDYAQAELHFEEFLILAEREGDRRGAANARRSLALVTQSRGDYITTERYLREALSADREVDDGFAVSNGLNNLGNLKLIMKNFGEAKKLFQQGLELAREVDARTLLPMLLNNLGLASKRLGEYDQAKVYYHEALMMARRDAKKSSEAWSLSHLGLLAVSLADYPQAQNYLAQSLQLFWSIGEVPMVLNTLICWAKMQIAQSNFEEAVSLLSFVLTHPVTDKPDQDSAQRLLNELQNQLPQDALTEAARFGKSIELDEVVRRFCQDYGQQ